ncbi:MAG: hypothetical protein KF821_05570 [Anaerolineales bacterium]|nr:hypothetical protein [Anaerolineales bacterium]MBX3005279.1 hypothetical protein [Anaerolineales bacterium]
MPKHKVQRVQILLEPRQQAYLARVSKKSGRSISALLRELVDEKMNASSDASLMRAARELQGIYQTDNELNAFSSLDAADWEDRSE